MTQERPAGPPPVLGVATDSDNKFWDYAKQHELRVQKCTKCGELRYPVSPICPKCMSFEAEWVPLSGKGKVISFIVVHRSRSPLFPPGASFVTAIIETAEGVRMLSNIVDTKPEDVKIGMSGQIVFKDIGPELTVPRFQLG